MIDLDANGYLIFIRDISDRGFGPSDFCKSIVVRYCIFGILCPFFIGVDILVIEIDANTHECYDSSC